MDERDEATEEQEFATRVVYSMFKPAVQMADSLKLPMKDMTGLLQRAYYQLKKSRGMTLAELADELQMSTRTADRLAKSLRENFFAAEQEHGLPRQMEFLLWSGPRSEARLSQLLPHVSVEELGGALESLRREGRVELQEGRTPTWKATRRANRLMDDTLAARVDALNHMLDTLRLTVWRRFFAQDRRAGARTVGLRVRREDLGQVEALYEEVLWPRLVALDDAAREAAPEDVVEVQMAVLWAPSEDEPLP
jgi:transcriptional regulator with XRE-family HTH domain